MLTPGNINVNQQEQKADKEKWVVGAVNAQNAQSKGGREWQAGVSSLTWVGQDEGKTLHLVIKPRWEDGGEEKGRDEKYVLDSDEFSGCVRPYLLVMLLPVNSYSFHLFSCLKWYKFKFVYLLKALFI